MSRLLTSVELTCALLEVRCTDLQDEPAGALSSVTQEIFRRGSISRGSPPKG